uniref:Ig-like domain-containing protein n=1 Tax=Anabas testudineus TaxID=64144 RepID=A0AAQ6IC40_ANATE
MQTQALYRIKFNKFIFCFLKFSCFFFVVVTGAAEIIYVYEGDSVSISCPYESQDQNNTKYICRGNQPSSCLQQALMTSNNTQNTQFSLTDDKKSKFTVTITSLTQKDSGSYLCGVKRNTGLDVFSAVDLEVKGERSQFKSDDRAKI